MPDRSTWRAAATVLIATNGPLEDSPAEFDEVAAELGRTLDFVKVTKQEKAEVLATLAGHKDEVTAGSIGTKRG